MVSGNYSLFQVHSPWLHLRSILHWNALKVQLKKDTKVVVQTAYLLYELCEILLSRVADLALTQAAACNCFAKCHVSKIIHFSNERFVYQIRQKRIACDVLTCVGREEAS